MNKLFDSNDSVDKEVIIETLMEDETINQFFIQNDIESDVIEASLNRLLSFQIENNHCINCKGLETCKQDVEGYRPRLVFKNNQIDLIYEPCQYLQIEKSKHNKKALIDALYMPKMIFDADLSDYDFSRGDNRVEIHRKLMTFLDDYKKGEAPKGLYLHGEYQQGKTFILAALANELTKQGNHVLLAYYPDLVRELKSRISTNTVESMVRKLKQTDVLMLDDIGGEAHSAWIRDEVLGPILQHRLLDHLPTFFSSNVSQRALVNYMTGNSQKAEKMKAARIFARINSLSIEVKI
jgi:primosomal protein DnaI